MKNIHAAALAGSIREAFLARFRRRFS